MKVQNGMSITLFSSVSIVDFEQVNVNWVVLFQGVVAKAYQQYFFRGNETGRTFSSFEKRFVFALILTKSFGT